MSHFAPELALVTGASSGLGELIAERLAARGASVVLVARRRDRLDALAERLSATFGVEATVLEADLSLPGAGRALWERLEGRTPDTLINAAGFGSYGTFAEIDPERISQEVTLNVTALVELTRAALPHMVAAGTGTIVNISSTASFQPMPGMAVYGATKSFVREFSEAIAYENRETGVHIVALCPGSTATEFFDYMGRIPIAGNTADPVEVVDQLMRTLDRRRPKTVLVTGLGNAIGATISRISPRWLVTSVAANLLGYSRPTAADRAERTASTAYSTSTPS